MKTLVVYGSRYGTTGLVAKALADGLRQGGNEVSLNTIEEVPPDSLSRYDIICVGAPTEAFSAYKPMKEFLAKVSPNGLEGKLGFTFDTKIDSRFSGSAAKYIESTLVRLGLRIPVPRESAIVSTTRTSGGISGAVLRDGEEDRFRSIGLELGRKAAGSRTPVLSA